MNDDDSEGLATSEGDILAPGSAFGRYTIVRQMGRGGMGEVYEALHTSLKKRVALKVLRPEVARNKKVLARFEREGVAVAKIDHPHVVDVFDVGVVEQMPYLVMEFLDGDDLGSRLKRQPLCSVERTVEIMLPVLSAVQAAHDEGIVHRDLKPANVFLSRTRQGVEVVKVLDFGISKISDGPSLQTLTGGSTLLGTPYYIPPELARGARNADARSDQYSLGVILYQCVTGRRPFAGPTLYETLHAIVQGRFEPPSRLREGLAPGFEAVILRALSRDPAARFADLLSMGRALLPFAAPKVAATWEPLFQSHPVLNTEDRTAPDAIDASGIEAIDPMPSLSGAHEGASLSVSLHRHDTSPSLSRSLSLAQVSALQAPPSVSSGSLEVGPSIQSISHESPLVEAEPPSRRVALWASAALAVLSLGVSAGLIVRARGPSRSAAATPVREAPVVSPVRAPVAAAPVVSPVRAPVAAAPVAAAPVAAAPVPPSADTTVTNTERVAPAASPARRVRPRRNAVSVNGAPILR
ncbi:MAG: serine/threonine protein kinase [Myxococcales bacterium]|nr:serine/threonine protein kinase [Myxococcales bacterium]